MLHWQVNCINAHATSTIVGDLAEVNALKKVFKDSSEIKMNATKVCARSLWCSFQFHDGGCLGFGLFKRESCSFFPVEVRFGQLFKLKLFIVD